MNDDPRLATCAHEVLSNGFGLCQHVALTPSKKTSGKGWHWWLTTLEGKTTAYAKTVYWADENTPHQLMEIEVEGSERGKGFTRLLISQIDLVLPDSPLHSTGNWTSDGARALHFLPLVPGYTPGVYHEQQNSFVTDWQGHTPRYA